MAGPGQPVGLLFELKGRALRRISEKRQAKQALQHARHHGQKANSPLLAQKQQCSGRRQGQDDQQRQHWKSVMHRHVPIDFSSRGNYFTNQASTKTIAPKATAAAR
jgi:hypothetical protein